VKCILSGGKPASLKKIIKHNDLPLDVQFAGSGDQSMVDIGGSEQTSSLFTLTLLHTYEDKNLRSGKYVGTAVIVLYKLPTKT
jgi:hypothetical protein